MLKQVQHDSKINFPRPLRERGSKKIAFTLAEVLITLGIIGVVAAMTIPNLITTHQKKVTVTKLQKAISVINQAYRLSYDENGEATAEEANTMGETEYFNKYWAPYIKVTQMCEPNYSKKCIYDNTSPYVFRSGSPAYLTVPCHGRATFYTPDGFVYNIMTNSGAGEGVADPRIFVDINGAKGPNMYGKDVFVLTRVIDDMKGGLVLPQCYSSNNVKSNCSKYATGDCCAEVIRRAGWQIEKDYPW